ncbi:hypothetical protein [Alteromonas sp. PRIM-21]|uniref:hypothetical protein n=1 Tax=Alteromonas sp. PRIM-21 TaxID=1454978 RepID=UPI0022B988EE|nr:hypothetical protein [Alteromonas sp. PRIM-21]MCZ8531506.1 hypothetical protein [Alteromonas sp. PRIM-21]
MTLILSLHNSAVWGEAIENGQVKTVESIESLSDENETQLIRQPIVLSQIELLLQDWSHIVVCYESFENALAEQLSSGICIDEAINETSSLYGSLLSLRKSYRKKIKLINLAQFQVIDDKGLEVLRELGWEIKNNFSATPSSIYNALAHQCIYQDSALKSLASSLEASTTKVTELKARLDIDEVLDRVKSDEAKITALEKETSSAINDKKAMEVALRDSNLNHQKALDEIKEIYNEQLQVLNVELSDNVNVCELLRLELKNYEGLLSKSNIDLTSSLEKASKQKRELERQSEKYLEAVAEIQLLSEKLLQFESERKLLQMKLNETTISVLESAKSLKKQQEKNVQLKDDYVKSRASEHKSHIKIKQLESSISSLKSKHLKEAKKLNREKNKLSNKVKELNRKLLSKSDKVQNLEYELNNIKHSSTWKLSAPVRAFSKKLKKEDPKWALMKQNAGLLYTSELFDSDWYLTTYPDIKESGSDPAEHYLMHGASEGRLPSASFDGDWYLKRYPDVAETGMNPLIHFIKYGIEEGRSSSPKLLESKSKG